MLTNGRWPTRPIVYRFHREYLQVSISIFQSLTALGYACGPYFRPALRGRKGAQIDIVFDRADQVITLCEMKYQEAPVGAGVIAEVEARAEILGELFPRRTVQKVLIVVNEVTRDLLGTGYFYRIIKADELLGEARR